MIKASLAAILLAISLTACTSGLGGGSYGLSGYSLIRAKEVRVGDRSMAVTPTKEWNRLPRSMFFDLSEVEDWTLNGSSLDGVSFVTNLKGGALVRQRSRDDRQVPKFRSAMTAPEIASMIESLFRVRGGTVDFTTTALTPRTFLGYPGFQQDFDHLDADEVRRKGRAIGAVIDGRLYLILFDATRSHYYQASIADVEAMAASARLVR